MANYEGMARTNYVKVKDIDELNRRLEEVDGLKLIKGDAEDHVGFIFTNEDPSIFVGDDMVDFQDWFAPFLEDGEVCVMTEIGFEKNRYYVGYSIAFNNKGDLISVNINDIYEKAKEEFGVDPSRAEY